MTNGHFYLNNYYRGIVYVNLLDIFNFPQKKKIIKIYKKNISDLFSYRARLYTNNHQKSKNGLKIIF